MYMCRRVTNYVLPQPDDSRAKQQRNLGTVTLLCEIGVFYCCGALWAIMGYRAQ